MPAYPNEGHGLRGIANRKDLTISTHHPRIAPGVRPQERDRVNAATIRCVTTSTRSIHEPASARMRTLSS